MQKRERKGKNLKNKRDQQASDRTAKQPENGDGQNKSSRKGDRQAGPRNISAYFLQGQV